MTVLKAGLMAGASLIALTGCGFTPEPSRTPGPTSVSPAPTASPTISAASPSPPASPAAETLGCDNELSPVTLVDHTGLVLGCTTSLGHENLRYNIEVSNPAGDTNVLDVTMGLTSCPVGAVAIDIWQPPPTDSLPRHLPGPVVRVDRTAGVGGCGWGAPANTSETFALTLDEAVDASNVEGFLTTGSEGTNTVQTHGKDFALKLESNSETYAAGSAISVSATSWYLGPGTTTVSTYGVVFGYEQLDGPSVMYPASELMCGDVRTLQKNDQETHANSVQLRVGVYRLIAVLSFADGACGGERVSVESSIVVHVVASTLDCSGPDVPVTLIDSTGLVERCRMNVKVDQVQQPTFTNPGNDLSTLRFTSITAPCTDSRVVHFIEQPGGYGLGVASQVHTPPPGYVGCDAIVWFSIDLDLRSEVDASRVALTP